MNNVHTCSLNLEKFTERARFHVSAFGASLDFGSSVWDISEYRSTRDSAGHKSAKLYFSTHEGGTSKSMKGRTSLAEPFASFVKALVRIRQELKPKSPSNHACLIRTCRYLHDLLANRGYDPTQLVSADFQLAANECKKREAETSCYRVGIMLVEVAAVLNRHGIGRSRIDFKNPFKRVTYDDTRIGKEHEKRRAKKLLAPEVLEALGEISNLVVEPADIVRMRALELLVSGGWRINELLTLQVDCEVTEDVLENGGHEPDKDGQPIVRYGIRYRPEKGAQPHVKWIPTEMVAVVKRAISDIKRHTQSAREVAKFLEENPGQAYLPEQFRTRVYLTTNDLVVAMNLSPGAGGQWLRTRGISLELRAGRHVVRREAIEEALLDMSPRRTQDSFCKYSEYLFLIHRNFCHQDKGTNPCAVEMMTDGRIDDFIQGRETERGRILSIFEKFGFTMASGDAIKLTSHQFRHWLNNLAQKGGMDQVEIARWFGRKDPSQNAAYDHISGMELAERVRAKLKDGGMRGSIADMHRRLAPVKREEFRESVLATVHTTDIGLCINDWSLAPCPNHGSCADCGDHLVEKGNAVEIARAETLLEENKWTLERVMMECEEETYGASNHLAHTRSIIAGLQRILDIHGDAEIPDGTLVHVDPERPSRYAGRPLDAGGDV